MNLQELTQKIEDKTARVAVIGLGYVGLPVACEFARAGFDVVGVELLSDRVQLINSGVSPIEGNEPGLDELLASVIKAGKLRATTDYSELSDRDLVLIDVETPVDNDHIPRYGALRAALKSLGPQLKPGALIIVESTISPGTIQNVVIPELAASGSLMVNQDYYLGNCPERVMPGKLLTNLRNVSRVVGGMTPETAQAMVALYRHIVQADLDPTDCVTAELVKTVENAYRDVQIAFANEVALICEAVGGNVWKVRELVNKSPGRQMHLAGAGVGGHCIPKDPWLLAYGVKDSGVTLQVIPAARAVNDSMPDHMVQLLTKALDCKNQQINGSRVLVMGYAYLEDSDDTRNSPSEQLVKRLEEMGASVSIHDPYVPGFQGNLLEKANGCHAAVIMVRHQQYLELNVEELIAALTLPIIIDGRKVLDDVQDVGRIYRGVGQ